MAKYLLQPAADHRLDEIYLYTLRTWGEAQADDYIRGLFGHFEAIADREVVWHPIPAGFEVCGYFSRYRHHFIYWKQLSDGRIGIVTILHERMHLVGRLRDDFFG